MKIVRPFEPTSELQPPTPAGFAEIVSDDFPVLHRARSCSFTLHTATTK